MVLNALNGDGFAGFRSLKTNLKNKNIEKGVEAVMMAAILKIIFYVS